VPGGFGFRVNAKLSGRGDELAVKRAIQDAMTRKGYIVQASRSEKPRSIDEYGKFQMICDLGAAGRQAGSRKKVEPKAPQEPGDGGLGNIRPPPPLTMAEVVSAFHAVQGSTVWLDARKGRATASQAHAFRGRYDQLAAAHAATGKEFELRGSAGGVRLARELFECGDAMSLAKFCRSEADLIHHTNTFLPTVYTISGHECEARIRDEINADPSTLEVYEEVGVFLGLGREARADCLLKEERER
jgi:hypothetical protein